MKTSRLKLIFGLALIGIVGFITLSSFTKNKITNSVTSQKFSVNITIDSDTTDEELADIKYMLSEHGITVKFSNIKRNDDGEILGIKIELKDENGNSAVSQTSSNMPIQTFSFGRKNGSLYVSQGKSRFGNFAFFGDDMDFDFDFNFDHDSIFKHHFGKLDSLHFDHIFKFDEDDNIIMFNDKSIDIDELKDRMNKMFIFSDEDGSFTMKGDNGNYFFFDSERDDDERAYQKFRFVDNPETEKLIVIDGEESDFETLDELAKNNKLESVDVLKSKTAMSLYGEKAKDGAIIATTK